MMKNLMTCSKAAEEVGVTKGTVCRWMRRGLISPEIMVGSCLLIDVDGLSQVAMRLRAREGRGRPRLGERK